MGENLKILTFFGVGLFIELTAGLPGFSALCILGVV